MNFSKKKLPKDTIGSLRRVPTDCCMPYDILLAPIYVYLQMNQKFVAIKAPLQFFSPAELEKYKPYKNFYLPEFIEQIVPFQRAGESVRNLLYMQQRKQIRTNKGTESIDSPLPQHELDDALLCLIGPLWRQGIRIEPFFLCFFANQVCSPFPAQTLSEVAEAKSELFELGLFRSSLAVFLALHIGYSDPKILGPLYKRIFERTLQGLKPRRAFVGGIAQLVEIICEILPNETVQTITLEQIQTALGRGTGGKTAKKLLCRLDRVKNEFIENQTATLFGEGGICDG